MKKFKVTFFDFREKPVNFIFKGINKAQIKRKLEKDFNRRKPYWKRKLGYLPDTIQCQIREVENE